jgi:hypothetical protein
VQLVVRSMAPWLRCHGLQGAKQGRQYFLLVLILGYSRVWSVCSEVCGHPALRTGSFREVNLRCLGPREGQESVPLPLSCFRSLILRDSRLGRVELPADADGIGTHHHQ